MPRSGQVKKRKIQVNTKYNDALITRFINRAMKNGKKSAAEKQFVKALSLIKEKTNQDPILVFKQAIENVKLQVEVRSRRVGGASYQIPTPIRGDRKESLAIRWVITSAKKRPSKEFHSFSEKLAIELIDAFNNSGNAIKKKEDTHKMADANKAFAHFRW